MADSFVAILMGSDSDLPVMQGTMDILNKLQVKYEVRITSAHRTPEQTREYVTDAQDRGCAVFVAGAGLAAHLAGAVAATTIRPVIGVPIGGGSLQGMDALLSTVQMPSGIPVATVAIGSTGAKNAGYLAAQIIGLTDPDLSERVREERLLSAEGVMEKNRQLQESLATQ
jgi:5-(carboxyamino)imidazole ribonucleotide mutase